MNNKVKLGINRTGIALSPRMGPEMLRAVEMYPPDVVDGAAMNDVRTSYAANAEPIGTMPPPSSLKEASRTMLEALKGNKAPVYIDKLGERLAFERTGSRLYEALFPRLAGGGSWQGGPTEAEIRQIHADEVQHFDLLKRCIEQLGGDPTVQTPAADVTATASIGLVQVLGDQRLSLRQALQGVLTAELVDNEGWSMLIELASSLGRDDHVRAFESAQAAEERHLAWVRGWLRAAIISDANMSLDEQPAQSQRGVEHPSRR